MKRIDSLWAWALSAGLVWAGGCALEPPQPAPAPTVTHKEPTAPPPAANAEEKITLPAGAAQPPAPFEGAGWEAMSDGQSLAGWREIPFAGHGEVHCQDGLIVLGMGDPFTGLNLDERLPQDEL